jgi:uncharacterized protein DUF5924/DUF2914 family protein
LAATLWARLDARYPWLGWLWRWGLSAWSLGLGLLTLFVFRRGLPHVGWIVGYVLLLWCLYAAFTERRGALEHRGRQDVVDAGEYVILSLCHNLLLFVLPAYYASATLGSWNEVFPAAVAALAVVTAVDPVYRRLIHPRAWRRHLLLAFSMFAALNVALPLVGVRPILALEGSAALAVLALVPAMRRGGTVPWRDAHARAALFACLAMAVIWYARVVVPPAPLFLARAVAARAVTGLTPVDLIEGSIPAAMVTEWGGLAAYTAVYAPGGLRQAIQHVWSRDGVPFARIPLSPVRGGRAEGFRTYSTTRNLRPPIEGLYTVDVVTASGQLIGRLRFTVTP